MENTSRSSLLLHTPSSTSDIGVNAQAPSTVAARYKNIYDTVLTIRNKAKVSKDDTTCYCCTLESLYEITDIVLIICGGIFVASSIAYFLFYSYGLYCFHNKEQASQN